MAITTLEKMAEASVDREMQWGCAVPKFNQGIAETLQHVQEFGHAVSERGDDEVKLL